VKNKCGEKIYENQIESKVEQVMLNISKRADLYDEITLSFITQNSSGGTFSFLSGAAKEKWETWVIPL
jgi:hypothetical protein